MDSINELMLTSEPPSHKSAPAAPAELPLVVVGPADKVEEVAPIEAVAESAPVAKVEEPAPVVIQVENATESPTPPRTEEQKLANGQSMLGILRAAGFSDNQIRTMSAKQLMQERFGKSLAKPAESAIGDLLPEYEDAQYALAGNGFDREVRDRPPQNQEIITSVLDYHTDTDRTLSTTPDGIVTMYRQNLNTTIGGPVTTTGGSEIHTRGILGEEEQRIVDRLQEIEKAKIIHQAHADYKKTGFLGLGKSEFVRENEKRRPELMQQLQNRRREIEDYWKRQPENIRAEQNRWLDRVELHHYLTTHTDEEIGIIRNNSRITAYLESITLPSGPITRETFLHAIPSFNGFGELTGLLYDQGIGDRHQPGLHDLESNLAQTEKNIVVGKKAAEGYGRKAKILESQEPEAMELTRRLQEIRAVTSYLQDHFLPETATISRYQHEIALTDQSMRQLDDDSRTYQIRHLTQIPDEKVRETDIVRLRDIASHVRSNLQAKRARNLGELQVYLSPVLALVASPDAPQVLRTAASLVIHGDLDLPNRMRVTDEDRLYIEAAQILLGSKSRSVNIPQTPSVL